MSFEFAVAVPLNNYSFEQFNQFVELHLNYISGLTLELAGNQIVSPVILGKANILEFGPSTHDDWEGALEEETIDDISYATGVTTITLATALDGDFNAGDFARARTIALGWKGDDDPSHTNRYYYRLNGYTLNGYPIRYAQGIYAGGVQDHYRIYQFTPKNSLQVDKKYSLVWKYKCTSTNCYVKLDWCKADETIISSESKNYTAGQATWLADSLAEKTSPAAANRAKISAYVHGAVGMLGVDDFILYHAINTSGESSTKVSLSQEPDLGSLDYFLRKRHVDKYYSKDLLRREYPDSLEDEPLKYVISARLTHLSSTDYLDLMALLDWQKKKNKIVFWPDVLGLPDVLVGYIDLRFRKGIWDLTRTDVDFTFMEA